MSEKTEVELVKAVFSNQQGEELLEMWRNLFGRRISYHPDNSTEHTAFLEGQRYFYQSIEDILNG